MTTLQKALNLLKKGQYADLFALLEKAKAMNQVLYALKKEFLSDRFNANFYDKLLLAVEDAFSALPIPSLLSFLPSPTSHFVGRKADLQMLYDNLKAKMRTVLVNGVGGVGKTTLAQKYAHDYQADYAHILWIRQNGDLWASFLQTDLLENLQLAYDNQTDRQVLFAEVLQKLKSLPATNLLLIDNYEPTESDQMQDTLGQLFALPAHWRVVCTSRVDVPIFDKTLRLDVLPAHEAIQVFKLHAVGKPQDDTEIDALLRMVGYHTLMTELLAKTYLRCIQFGTVGKMHAFLQEKGLQNPYLEKKIYIETQSTYLYAYLRKVFSLANLTKDERWLLKQWAVLPTALHQASDFLTWIQDTDLAYENTLLALAEKGWLQTEDYLAYALHPFLQLFLLEELKPTFLDCEKIWDYFTGLMVSDEVQANPLAHQWTIAIGEAMVQNIGFTGNEEKRVILWNSIFNAYRFLGNTSNFIEFAKDNLDTIKSNLGIYNQHYATFLNNLASLYDDINNYTKALPLHEEALQIRKKVLGKQHLDYAQSLNNLAELYRKQCEYAKALPLYQDALQIRKKVLGEQHPDYARSLHNLAKWYQDQFNYTKALPLYQEALQIRKEILGERHPSYATSLHNIGTLYFEQGDYQQARVYLEEAYSIRVEKLGKQHPLTKSTKEWLDDLP